MTPSERQEKILTSLNLIYEILWDMRWFGDFGTRQEYIKERIDCLKDILGELKP